MARYKLLYRYSTDNGISWTDLTPAVDSSKTTITQNICTNSFKSAKDSATFTLPATSEAVKDSFLNALLGTSEVLVEICGPGPVSVMWGDDDARWGDLEVLWEGRVTIFTGYVDRSNISLKSYPFPTSITVTVNDVSTLKLDDKVNRHVDLQNKTVTEIVWYLLYLSGYATETQKDNPPTSILSSEDMTLEAFVIDKENSDTYRSYIDTLLFEVGGYVLDFDETGTPRIVRLQWDSTTGYTEVDNPLISEGISTKTALLEEDGVSLKWATLSTTSEKEVVWMDSISRKYEDGVLVGDQVENGHYWPEDGDIEPVYQEYVASLMDTPYLVKDTRKQNKDISIIAVRDVEAVIAAQKGSEQFTAWTYQVPEGFGADYGLTENPSTWPTKAWYLLYNNSGATVNLQMMELRGKVTYRSKINTSKTENTENPKEYTSQYIFSKTDAERFMTFYWNFLQTSRTTVTWKEPNSERNLGDVVRLSHKGLENSQYYAVISGKTESWIGFTKITSYTAVGISETHETVTIKTQGTASSAAVTAQDGKDGEDGEDGKDAKVLNLTCDSAYLIKNLRDSNDTSVTFRVICEGYEEEPQLIGSDGAETYDISILDDGTAIFDYTPSTVVPITFTLSCGEDESIVRLNVDDQTVYGLYLGICDEEPSQTPDGEPLVNGDYFLGNKSGSYPLKGVPFIYLDDAFTEMSLSSAENAQKALNCLSGAMESGIQLPESENGLWKWVGNLVAQNAAIKNLFSQMITILSGGSIRSEEYSETAGSEKGFRIKSDGDAVFANARIIGDSTFSGKFDCGVIKTQVQESSRTNYATNVNTSKQAYNIAKAMVDAGMEVGKFYSAEILNVTSPVKYIKIPNAPKTLSLSGNRIGYVGSIYFYDELYREVKIGDYVSMTYQYQTTKRAATSSDSTEKIISNNYIETSDNAQYVSYYVSSGMTIVIKSGGNRLLVEIPNTSEGLSTGMLYSDGGTVKVKL